MTGSFTLRASTRQPPGRPMVDIAPSEAALRRRVTWRGMTAELVEGLVHDGLNAALMRPSISSLFTTAVYAGQGRRSLRVRPPVLPERLYGKAHVRAGRSRIS
jgi:hypothetical protein